MDVVTPPSSSPLLRLCEIRRWEGHGALRARLAARLGYRRVGWWVRALDGTIAAAAMPAGLRFIELSAEDTARYLALRRGATSEQVAGRFAAGHRGWALVAGDGGLAAVAWTARQHGHLAYLALPLALGAGEIYLFDTFTAPTRRGSGLQPLLTEHLLRAAQDGGATRASAAIEPENLPSVRAFERRGFRRRGTLARIGFGRLSRVVRRGEVPR